MESGCAALLRLQRQSVIGRAHSGHKRPGPVEKTSLEFDIVQRACPAGVTPLVV